MSDKISSYIVSFEVAEKLKGLMLDEIDVIEKAKKMLNNVNSYKIGSINDIPVYVSKHAPEDEIMIMKKQDLDLPVGPVFVPDFKI